MAKHVQLIVPSSARKGGLAAGNARKCYEKQELSDNFGKFKFMAADGKLWSTECVDIMCRLSVLRHLNDTLFLNKNLKINCIN